MVFEVDWNWLSNSTCEFLCRFYHIPSNLCRLLLLITNEVIERAKSLVDSDIFMHPEEVKVQLSRQATL